MHPDGRVERKLEGLACANGLCWSRDGATLYFIDSGDRRVDGKVLRIDPDRGRVLGAVRVPAQNVTSCTFGGPTLSTLYITTARDGASASALALQPDAGSVFAFDTGRTRTT